MKSLIKQILVLLLVSALAASAASCTKSDKTVSKKTVGILMPTKLSERWINDGNYIVQQCRALGYNTELSYAENDVKTQVSQTQAMIDSHVSCLIISPIDSGSFTQVLSKANTDKIAVISYDRLIMNTSYVNYYATFDNYKIGVLQGSYIVDRLNLKKGKGPYNIELFAGSPDDNNAYFFYSGSMSVLNPYITSGQLVVRSRQTKMSEISTLRWDGPTAQARMTNLLSEDYRTYRLDAVLSPYDGISIGILSALRDAGYGTTGNPWPIVTGQDAEIASIKSIIAGEQTMTIFKDTRKLAQLAVEMANDVMNSEIPPTNDIKTYNNGQKIVPAYLLTPELVTQENYFKELVTSGYYTSDQLYGAVR